MKILYIGWIGCNNVGDELMFSCFKKLAKEKLGEETIIKGILCNEKYDSFEGYDIVCLGGGSILIEGFIDVIFRALEKGKKIIVWGTGYDSLDEISYIFDLLKRNFVYLYPDLTEEKINLISKKAMFFGVRGPITYRILEKSNVYMSNVLLSGDPGFLIEGSGKENKFKFNKNDNVVGINIGTSMNAIYGRDEEKILNSFIKISNYLIELGYKIYLYSVWPKDNDIILNLYNKIESPKNVICDIDKKSGEELFDVIKNCVFTINFKLHGNILSATAGVPFICLGYRLKCFDFVESIDCEDLIIKTDSNDIYEELKTKVSYIELNKDYICKKMKRKINTYKSILYKTFERFLSEN